MRITQWGEYGVHFAVLLGRRAREGAPVVGAADIAEAHGIDLQYAQQILQRLRKGEVIESVRGPQGGYRLSRRAEEISLLDILVATEGETFALFCDHKPLDAEVCSGTSCGLKRIWSDLKTHVDAFLQNYLLSDLVAQAALDTPDAMGSLIQISARPTSFRGGTNNVKAGSEL